MVKKMWGHVNKNTAKEKEKISQFVAVYLESFLNVQLMLMT
jgi:hypothetical protein